jgi:hypothetical protein
MFKLRELISLMKYRNVTVFGVSVEESCCTAGDSGLFTFIVLYFGPDQVC